MKRKNWITDIFNLEASNTVYFMFTLYRMMVVGKSAPHDAMKVVQDGAKIKR
jgi:hypothetical protein